MGRDDKRIKITCDERTMERIVDVFDNESERCFFGHGHCDVYRRSLTGLDDGPDCRNCIRDRVEWNIT